MNVMYSKKKVSALLLLLAFPVVLYFQNCSNRAEFSAVGEVGQDQNYQTPVSRSFEVSPITDKLTNEVPIKFLLVVDDSGTMKNSQENLARSINQISTFLQEHDAEVMVITTDSSQLLVHGPGSSKSVNNIKTVESSWMFDPQVKKFKIQKTMNSSEKNSVLDQLAAHILNLGTNGSVSESPLRSIAYALEDSTFFKPGDNALIYVISDENDDFSVASTEKLVQNFLKYKKEVRNEVLEETVPAHYVDGYRWKREYYQGEYSEKNSSKRCGEADDFGDKECKIVGTTIYFSAKWTTSKECQDYIAGHTGGSCKKESKTNHFELKAGETLEGECAKEKSRYGAQVTSCVYAKLYVDEDTIRTGGELLSLQQEFFLGMTEQSKDLKVAIKRKLESLFAGNYLVAAQVNIENQNCQKGPSQTFDKEFLSLKSILPDGRLLRASICEEAAISGEILRTIATQLTINISNNYRVSLQESERILQVTAVRGTEQRSLLEGTDFVYNMGILTLTHLRASDFEVLRIDVGLKENWHLQQ